MSCLDQLIIYGSADSLPTDNMSIASTPYFPRSPSPELEYLPDAPNQQIILRPLKMDDDEVSDKYLSPSPCPAATLSNQLPPQIRIKVEELEGAQIEEVQDEQNAANDVDNASDKDAEAYYPASMPSHVHRELDLLYRILHPRHNAKATDDRDLMSLDSRSSGWDSNDDEEYQSLWPSPPTTPIKGDDQHPLQPQVCGPHPGQGWEINSYGTQHYYRFLIPDPSTCKSVVAPFLSYSINQSRPTVSGTYSQEFPIRTRPLTATCVDYTCPTITAGQEELFSTKAPFALAIEHVLAKFAPFDLAATIHQYQYYKDTQYAIQMAIRKLQEKEMRYVERAVEVLSDLENANALGRILAHDGDTLKYTMENLDSHATLAYVKIAQSFKGRTAQSALNTRTRHKSTTVPGIISLPLGTTQHFKNAEKKRTDKWTLDDEIEEQLRGRAHTRPTPSRHPRANTPLHRHERKKCYRCHEWGHVARACPVRPYRKLGLRK
jgi:hypothetical protein